MFPRDRGGNVFDYRNKGIVATCPQGHIEEVIPKDQVLGLWFCHHPLKPISCLSRK